MFKECAFLLFLENVKECRGARVQSRFFKISISLLSIGNGISDIHVLGTADVPIEWSAYLIEFS